MPVVVAGSRRQRSCLRDAVTNLNSTDRGQRSSRCRCRCRCRLVLRRAACSQAQAQSREPVGSGVCLLCSSLSVCGREGVFLRAWVCVRVCVRACPACTIAVKSGYDESLLCVFRRCVCLQTLFQGCGGGRRQAKTGRLELPVFSLAALFQKVMPGNY